MAIGVRLEGSLDGAGNFVPWKARIVLILEDNELWDEVVHSMQENPIQVLAVTNAQALSTFNKKDIKARRIILDAVMDHVILHISGKVLKVRTESRTGRGSTRTGTGNEPERFDFNEPGY